MSSRHSNHTRNRKQSRGGRLSIILIVLMFLVIMSVQITKLYQKEQDYTARETDLQEQLEEETQRQSDLEAYEEYTKTQEYTEDIAKSKLGLVFDNEIVFKEDKDSGN